MNRLWKLKEAFPSPELKDGAEPAKRAKRAKCLGLVTASATPATTTATAAAASAVTHQAMATATTTDTAATPQTVTATTATTTSTTTPTGAATATATATASTATTTATTATATATDPVANTDAAMDAAIAAVQGVVDEYVPGDRDQGIQETFRMLFWILGVVSAAITGKNVADIMLLLAPRDMKTWALHEIFTHGEWPIGTASDTALENCFRLLFLLQRTYGSRVESWTLGAQGFLCFVLTVFGSIGHNHAFTFLFKRSCSYLIRSHSTDISLQGLQLIRFYEMLLEWTQVSEHQSTLHRTMKILMIGPEAKGSVWQVYASAKEYMDDIYALPLQLP